jgi:hypothetical protein
LTTALFTILASEKNGLPTGGVCFRSRAEIRGGEARSERRATGC